jgi:threonine synthase
MFRLVDYLSRESVSTDSLVFTGDDTPWEVEMDIERIRSLVNHDYFRKSPALLSKYLPFLPIKDWGGFVSLKEGGTPLIQSKRIGPRLGIDLYFKVESKSPTGSFKDRGSAVEVTVARECGAKGIVVASTGNMAASCACYAAAANIPCFVFVPEDVPASKLAQVIAFGGRIVQVKGTYNDAASLAVQAAKELKFYLAGDYAFRVEGAKTAAFEIIDQMYFQPPDVVVVPMGCGTNIASYAKGFAEFKELGFIDNYPKLIGVQAAGAAAIINAFDKGSSEIEALDSVQTIASAIAVPDPLDGAKALNAIRDTEGSALAVTDQDMLEAQYMMSREEGLFVEASGGAVLSALLQYAQENDIRGQKVVLVLCGDGLKDPSTVLKVAIKPPIIDAEISEFISLYESKFFDGRSVAFVDKEEVVFDSEPQPEEIKAAVTEMLNVSFSDVLVARIQGIISKFLLKGKAVTFSDFQDIIQDALEQFDSKKGAELVVKDFEVITGKDKKPKAKVLLDVSGQEYQGQGEGVGPVDAVIQALRNACGDKLHFRLAGYTVDIRSQGADAVVHAELKLKRDGKLSVGRGASPDIIQASIEAFEEAYNGL